MSNMRAFSDSMGSWGGCDHESYDFATIEPFLRDIEDAPVEKRKKLLMETVERQVIPILSRSHAADRLAKTASNKINDEVIKDFVRVLIDQDVEAEVDHIEKIHHSGVDFEGILLGLFAPAARTLGEMWEEDVCDFTTVTLALSQLHQLLHRFGTDSELPVVRDWNGRTALLVAAPGDQHTFGVMILQEFFRRAGWHVEGGAVSTEDELLSMAQSDRYDVVGISVSHDTPVDKLASIIRAVRKVSPTPGVRIMVGGRFFLARPECVAMVGADASAQDGRRAVEEVSSLLDQSA
ncbi:MAG: cobalamin B12-binding domain-containing protein [Pseudomonadota bacterium]